MHNLILGKRNSGAMERILKGAKALGEHYQIDPSLASALKVQEKDPLVRAMKEREAVADLLDAISVKLGLTTEEPTIASDPVGESTPVTGETGEGLPPVETEPTAGKSKRQRASRSKKVEA